MAASLRSQIMAAALAVLNTNRPGGIPAFTEERTEAMDPAVEPLAGDLVFLKQPTAPLKPAFPSGVVVVRTLHMGVRIFAAGSASQTPEDAADAMYVWASKALTASTLGGLVKWVMESDVVSLREQKQLPFGRVAVIFEAPYCTSRTDPSLKSSSS